ncbi:MAG: NAD(P)-dependent oxidoreductase [Isosphaeraceae bacterium]
MATRPLHILLTGGSSFTGAWFARALAAAGHQVTAIFRKPADAYDDPVRRRRVAMVAEVCHTTHGLGFGDDAFLALLKKGPWDVLAHHAADVTNYKSPDFDTVAAVANNTHNLPAVLEALKAGGGKKVLLTGSVFEGGEGAGSQGLPDFSPYGLSKALTARVFQYYCQRAGVTLGKFVIPNPFGPFEEPRFTGYLMKNWLAGKGANCSSPTYVRDNIHVSLLAAVYAQFAASLPDAPGFVRINPSGYAESQGAFTLRLAQEMQPRLNLPCEVELLKQTDFPEPVVRLNTDIPDHAALGWSESAAWDAMAEYYLSLAKV